MTVAERRLRTCCTTTTVATAYIMRGNNSTAGNRKEAITSDAHPMSGTWAGQQRVNGTGEGQS
jgi:hypothetical protein